MSFLLKNYQKRLAQCFIHEIKKAKDLLDIGCGDGVLWEPFFAHKVRLVVGIDIKPYPSWKSLASDNISFIVADAHALPFKTRAFDMVFEKDLLHHVNLPKVVLREMGRVSRKMIVLVEGNRYNPLSFFWMVKIKGHNHFTLSQLKAFVQAEHGPATIKIYQKEAHFPPLQLNGKFLVQIFDKFQDILEKFLKKLALANYNVVILEKKYAKLK